MAPYISENGRAAKSVAMASKDGQITLFTPVNGSITRLMEKAS